jgi:hypothetical protein
MVLRIESALYDYEDNEGTIQGATFGDLANHIVANALSDCTDREISVPVVPQAPVVPSISPATISLFVGVLNANERRSLGRNCEGVCVLRDSAITDGLIKEVDLDACESCVDEPVEAPVAPTMTNEPVTRTAPMITRKHFEAIAAAVSEMRHDEPKGRERLLGHRNAVYTMADKIADVCAESNGCFDKARFLRACGV